VVLSDLESSNDNKRKPLFTRRHIVGSAGVGLAAPIEQKEIGNPEYGCDLPPIDS
jgi:hypothetical protein